MMKLMVPALLYTVQNNLLYVALKNLDAATYMVCYQTKILTTAIFSVLLLKRRLTSWKWIALLLLTIGVALSEVSTQRGAGEGDSDTGDEESSVEGSVTEFVPSRLVGFVCVLSAACTSGFSGVYFEMILKSSKTSLFVRNIQMGLPSIALSLLTVAVKDGYRVRANGFFQGYNSVVVGVIMLQAAGGLVVAVVVKYADNIRKSFAAAVSIIAACILSMIFFDFKPTKMFAVGVTFVCGSIYMYGRPAPEKGLPAFNWHSGVERRRSVIRRI
ncbi:unnamed protein product [Sphacelaria rigidula]